MVMSFEKRFFQCLQNLKNIEKPDYPRSETNLYADFVELLVLFSKGDGIAYGDVQDRFFGEPDEKNSSETNDADESFLCGIFSLIEERSRQYGRMYPFNIDNEQTITLNKKIALSQKLYLFLLISSSLDIFNPFNADITTDFESVSLEVVKSFLPNATVRSFGKISDYKGTAKDKIMKLAEDVGIPLNDHEIECIGERNVQERGLDLVAWIPFEDKCQNKIVFYFQCACGKQYEFKQHDLRRFENYFSFYKKKPLMTLLIPYALINPNNGKFYHSDYIEEDYLVLERLRILNFTRRGKDVYTALQSRQLVERCIQDNWT